MTAASHRAPVPAGSATTAALAMWALVAVVVANAASHLRTVCWSLIASDNWNHVHPLLRDTFEGRLDLGNFLVQRAGVDHAQPLNKLVMWANARWFGLDFMLEGFLGLAFGVAMLLVLYRLVGAETASWRPTVVRLGFAAVAAVFFSLNSSFIYTYSMVTMWFALYFLAFVVLLAAWRALSGGRVWPVAVATFLLGVVADDSAALDTAAVAIAVGLFAWRRRAAGAGPAPSAWPVIAALAAGLLASRGLYWAFGETSGTTQAVFNQPLSARLAGLASQWRDAWDAWAIPSVYGLLGKQSLPGLAGGHAPVLRDVLAVAMLGAHAWFWWSATRLRAGAAWLAATTLMLMFYAHVAAILLARVFARGTGYLEQERYVSFYQFGVVALLLMAMTWVLQRPESRAARRGLATLALALLLLQVPVTRLALEREPGISRHNLQMAMDMAALGRDPLHPPNPCTGALDLCVLPPERRVELVRLLRDHRLSLFSPQYARRHPEHRAAVERATGR